MPDPLRIAAPGARRPDTRPDRGAGVGLEPVPGYYSTRLVRAGQETPVVIWFGPPLDPETGLPLDRAHRLQCRAGGEDVDPLTYWPLRPISREEYRRLVAAMSDDPRRPIDVRKARTF